MLYELKYECIVLKCYLISGTTLLVAVGNGQDGSAQQGDSLVKNETKGNPV